MLRKKIKRVLVNGRDAEFREFTERWLDDADGVVYYVKNDNPPVVVPDWGYRPAKEPAGA